VNRPELLPTEATSVIDVAGFLTPSEVTLVLPSVECRWTDRAFWQERRIAAQLNGIEQDTGTTAQSSCSVC
jgi:hypothetical protein